MSAAAELRSVVSETLFSVIVLLGSIVIRTLAPDCTAVTAAPAVLCNVLPTSAAAVSAEPVSWNIDAESSRKS